VIAAEQINAMPTKPNIAAAIDDKESFFMRIVAACFDQELQILSKRYAFAI